MKLIPLKKEDYSAFMKACQVSFSLAVQEEKDISDELISPDEDLLESLHHPDAQSFFIYWKGLWE